ncbi:MAG: ABC transporter ATP-binding protein, partial [Bdellovibrionales bacterium]|nr:ABC transporter ATP-binding protein [Bdellovibrionales bacterium]
WLFPPWALSEVITFAAQWKVGVSTSYAWYLLLAILMISVLHFLLHEFAKYTVFQVAEYASLDAYRAAISHLLNVDLEWHEQENCGNKMQRIAKGSSSINRMLRMYVSLVIESGINVVAILVILGALHPVYSIALLVFFVTYYWLSYQLMKRPARQSTVVNIQFESFSGLAFQVINNIFTVKALRLNDYLLPVLKDQCVHLFEEIRKRIQYFRLRAAVLNIFQEMARILIVGFTCYQIFQGKLEVGILALVLLYFGKVKDAAYELAETSSEWISARIDMSRIHEIMRLVPKVEFSGTSRFDPGWQELCFEHVSFGYGKREILQEFSLRIKKGEKIGIVGMSGVGKSTLVKLLLKVREDYRGDIRFDELSLRDIERGSYIEHVAVVPQETELFNLSLRDNVTCTWGSVDEERFESALKIAQISDFLPKLPHGVISLVGEKGIRLSGGERQRVGIARALYRTPQLLLLDEATSHLDTITEQNIQDAFHSVLEQMTVIVVAHRLATVEKMDRIIVLENGRILEMGTKDELLSLQGQFYQLWMSQMVHSSSSEYSGQNSD